MSHHPKTRHSEKCVALKMTKYMGNLESYKMRNSYVFHGNLALLSEIQNFIYMGPCIVNRI